MTRGVEGCGSVVGGNLTHKFGMVHRSTIKSGINSQFHLGYIGGFN